MSAKYKPIWSKIVKGIGLGFAVLGILSIIFGIMTVNKILPQKLERIEIMLVLIVASYTAGWYVMSHLKTQKLMYALLTVGGLTVFLALTHAVIMANEPFLYMDNLIAAGTALILIVLTKGMRRQKRRY